MTDPAVSIVIVTYESGPVLTRCLAQLREQTFRDFEVLLVDNGSTDGAAQTAARSDPSLTLVDQTGLFGLRRRSLRGRRAAELLRVRSSDLGTAPADGLVVGDSRSDVGSARAAGCPVIAVSYGYPHGPVADLGADVVLDRMPGLLNHLTLPTKAV